MWDVAPRLLTDADFRDRLALLNELRYYGRALVLKVIYSCGLRQGFRTQIELDHRLAWSENLRDFLGFRSSGVRVLCP